MRFLRCTSIFFLSLAAFSANAQNIRNGEFSVICDSLRAKLLERTGVDQELSLNRVVAKGGRVDLYFSQELSFYPWRESDVKWFTAELAEAMDTLPGSPRPGNIFTNRYSLPNLVLPELTSDGKPLKYEHAIKDPRSTDEGFVRRIDGKRFPKGLDGRYIALWQSHGKYYDESRGVWTWQRAPMHRTVEDMFTQTFVLPFLMPMLENSGAYVMTPRERDTQWREIIIDNDPSFDGPREGKMRRSGIYREKGEWQYAGTGFADTKPAYTFADNPFTSGTARSIACSPGAATASATWTPYIEERGEYAVYVSYASLPGSSTAARYTVTHLGGKTTYTVNQKRGGGTWIYLGTFEFDKGDGGNVRLDNCGKEGCTVSADAVKIGGGTGKLERGGKTSGARASEEGAHYWMQWAGTDSTITRAWSDDYTDDFATRGAWTSMMREQKGIPFDLALAFHTDAGLTPNDSTVGTLAIYTLRCDGEREFPDGRDRIISRLLCDNVQSQIVNDIRADFDSTWTRRGLWDRSYSECRTAGVPAMILELLSHQNLADMKYGLDPAFRFDVCRAVYKGILKTLSTFYGCPYVVQPLPVRAFAAELTDGDRVRLSWHPTTDKKEPTARSRGYIVYTRVDDGAFDSGVETESTHMELPLERGHVYSFKVVAFNDGGKSFPSEILSAGIPEKSDGRKVAIVNNFTRVGAPESVDGERFAGFTARGDSGVPYIREIGYIGEVYEFDRSAEFVDNDYPGFGACHSEMAGEFIAGNTFDFPYIHGTSLLKLGRAFDSLSSEAFCEHGSGAAALDLLCGKQGTEQYPVFPESMKTALRDFTAAGGNVLVSGANIATDGGVATAAFTSSVLGYKAASPHGTSKDEIGGIRFSHTLNPDIYCVEAPDGIKPAGKNSRIWLRYGASPIGGAVLYKGRNYRTVSIAVPLETVLKESDREWLLRSALEYFDGNSEPVNHQ